jgi:AmmeMemoRadiSam system protein A
MIELQAASKARLLRVARQAIEAHLLGRPAPTVPDEPGLPACGVFVTLRSAGRLRGCIGTLQPHGPLLTTIFRMAVAAAQDPRFTDMPIGAAELSRLRIELSLLSPLVRVSGLEEIRIGVHGILVRRGEHSGCFLPEVAAERGWDAATFLGRCCSEKAGLDPLAWMQQDAEIHVFTVNKIVEPT